MENSEEPLCRFGTPLEPLEEDDIPAKKPVAIEDQIVTDENGKRRFHGAFTGGFSAGFWNTVGSLEGWKPQSFKSSRSEKAQTRQIQLPTDFMDDEDLGEFGIAPQRVQTREDFAKNDSPSRKRKLVHRDSGQIPGIPILQQLEAGREKVAVRLLRRMGWKPGQGIGTRQTRNEKTRSNQQNIRELYVMKKYGCEMDPSIKVVCPLEKTSSTSDSEEEEDVTFAPDDFEPFVCIIKDNTFGLGYSGLSCQLANDSKSHINLFTPLEVLGKTNKVLSITGQAFGVGALEEDDEDIYARDDMSRYDFTLENKKKEKRKPTSVQLQSVLEGYAEASFKTNVQKKVQELKLKSNFQPRNWLQRKSRFETLSEEKMALLKQSDLYKIRGLGRHDLDSDERRKILDDREIRSTETKKSYEADVKKQSYLQHISEKYAERSAKNKNLLELLSSKSDCFVKGGLITKESAETLSVDNELSEDIKIENSKVVSKAKDITKSLDSPREIFRPFANNEAKQERYVKFIDANLKHEEEIKAFLHSIQPIHLSEWDKERECKEFIQARSIYKPLSGSMSERFTSKSNVNVTPELPKTIQNEKIKVIVKRTKALWKPAALICKRFNIEEPLKGTLPEPKISKKKISVFDYIEGSINSKKDFVTPVIIPKRIPKAIQIEQGNLGNLNDNISPKELLSDNKSTAPVTSNNCTEINPIQTQVALNKTITDSKTELELRVEESKYIHPSEKKDLFKCIFDSSDDESAQGDRTDDDDPQKSTSKTVVSDEIAKTLLKPSAPINILRHNSPPRGIFAALFSNPVEKEAITEPSKSISPHLNKVIFKPKHDRDVKQNMELEDTYGPRVPSNLVTAKHTTDDNEIDKKIIRLLSSSSKSSRATNVIETWVEKTGETRKKSKKEKKEKKKNRKEKKKIKEKTKKNKRNKT